MYDFSDEQCQILKSIERDALKMNYTAILDSIHIKDIPNTESILQSLVGDGLFHSFKPLRDKDQFSDSELQYIEKAYGKSIYEDATKYGEGYLIYLTPIFEEDWNYIAKNTKAHDRIKLHNGIYYELKYDEHKGFMLRYYDYYEGLCKDVMKIYDDTAAQALISKCFEKPNTVIRIDDLKVSKCKNISQIISSLKLPNNIRDLFFREITRKTVYFTPHIKRRNIIVYDQESLDYLEDSKKI